MRIAPPPRFAPAGVVLAASLCLFGFGFLAGLTLNAPWGFGPAAISAVAALALAVPPLAWMRRRGAEAAEGAGPAWLSRLDPPSAYGVAVALAMAAGAMLLLSRSWHAANLFWPACFGLASAGATVFGDARARAEVGPADDPGEGSCGDDIPAVAHHADPATKPGATAIPA